jgi:sulfur-oxidizing protein SoxB
LSGGSHDPLPEPLVVQNAAGRTLVSSVGAYGKFCGVLDLDVQNGRLGDHRFRLIPIFSNLISPDPAMAALIEQQRAPFTRQLDLKLAGNETLLYRRDNFMSSTDALILRAIHARFEVDIAFTPGYRWGTTIVPGEPITLERLLEQVAAKDAAIHLEVMAGRQIQQRLEQWADELFNPDPYRRSGNDMVRAGGLTYRCHPAAKFGSRIRDVLVRGVPLREEGRYQTANWGLFGPAHPDEPEISSILATYLTQIQRVSPFVLSRPVIEGIPGNRGRYGSG